MQPPRISIITVSYNQGQFLEETILSVINQNYANLEYIIVDGGSTDNSVEIIKKYDKHIKYWISEKDNGQSHGINKGLVKATGAILTWINSDDLLLPDSLLYVSEAYSKEKFGLLHGKTILFNDDNLNEIKGAKNKDLELRYLSGIPYPQPSSFFSRDILLKYGYLDEQLHYAMDYDLLVRIVLNNEIIVSTKKVLSKYRLHNASKSMAHSHRFGVEWCYVYNKVIKTLGNNNLKDWLQEVDLYVVQDPDNLYPCQKKYADAELNLSFFFFLENQFYFFYEALDLKSAVRIGRFIQEKFPLQDLGEIITLTNRAGFLPAFIIKLSRYLKR